MKKVGLVILLLLFLVLTHAQNLGVKPNWRIDKPFEQKVFIENNEGQFDGKIDSGKVLFSANVDGLSLFFTATGVTYRYEESIKLSPEQREERERNKGEEDLFKPIPQFFSAKWSGANPNAEIIAEDEVGFYYCYPLAKNHTTIAHAFKKIFYKNLYQGIDIEYKFPNDTSGIQYTIIVHPRGDISLVRLIYNDAKTIIQNANGDIEIQSTFGKFIDHAPEKTWYQENNERMTSSFNLKGNEISFNAGNYDKSKTLIIDPWTINPSLDANNSAYDLDWDYKDNVYAYGCGSYSSTLPNQLIKLDSSGKIQWIFDAVFGTFSLAYYSYGDFAVDKNDGTSYIGLGWGGGQAKVLKVNTSGIQTDSVYNLPGTMEEIWRMQYDECNGTIILGGGGTDGECLAEILDTNLSYTGPFNLLGTTYICHDVVLMTIDYSDGSCFFTTSRNDYTDAQDFDNVLIKTPNASLTSVDYIVPDGYSFLEGNINYTTDQVSNGMNGMIATPNWLYIYDGSVLKRFDKNSGNLIKSINTPAWQATGNTSWGGLDADRCGNIYLGNKTDIEVYDSTLTLISTIATIGNIYDLGLASNNLMYACGNGFISSYTLNNPHLTLNKIKTSACSNCNGTALVSFSGGCGSNNASYLWNTGQTTQYITGLCPGSYTVTASLDCTAQITDTFNIDSSANPALNIPTTEVINVSCNAGDNGSITAIASGGTSPYGYIWYPNDNTNQTLSNMGTGTYTVITTDSKGCGALDTITVFQPLSPLTLNTSPNISINVGQDSILTASASGGTPPYTYTWEVGSTGTSFTASPLVTTTYSVLVTDNNGCTAVQYITVDVICGNLFVPTAFSPNDPYHNNILYVRDKCIEIMDFLIFDRWGNKVFESQNPDKGWDGTNKGLPMNMGTYVWYLKATLYDGTNIEKKGNVSLVR